MSALIKRADVLGVIPARLASSRLPGKVLRPLAGIPMVEWVYRAASACPLLDRVLIATDAQEVMEMAAARGLEAVLTSPDCATGSDRVYEVSRSIQADIYVNIQGDEPLLLPEHFDALLGHIRTDPSIDIATVSAPLEEGDISNSHIVKVVTSVTGRALYFSRAAIPYDRDAVGYKNYRKHLGLYAYRRAALEQFAQLTPTPLEQIEKLEQLRMLENDMTIHVAPVEHDSVGVDTEPELAEAERLLIERYGQNK